MAKSLSQLITIDITDLPGNAQQEMVDFYNFLRTKYSINKRKKKRSPKDFFLANVENHRFHLTSGYKFSRDEANER